jgi:hypothetical protein
MAAARCGALPAYWEAWRLLLPTLLLPIVLQLCLRYQDVDLLPQIEQCITGALCFDARWPTRHAPRHSHACSAPLAPAPLRPVPAAWRQRPAQPGAQAFGLPEPHVLQQAASLSSRSRPHASSWLQPGGPSVLMRPPTFFPLPCPEYLAGHPDVDPTISARCVLQEFSVGGPVLSFRVRSWVGLGGVEGEAV